MTLQEIAIAWNSEEFEGDLNYVNGDLALEQGLYSAVLISLFTDARAADDDILPNILDDNRRGWWGDLVNPLVKNDKIGSRLWLLERSKTLPEVLVQAKEYIKESLQWLVEDGLASKIEVETERQPYGETTFLAFRVTLYLILESVQGASMSFIVNAQFGSSGTNYRELGPLTFDGISGMTFDGVDELIF